MEHTPFAAGGAGRKYRSMAQRHGGWRRKLKWLLITGLVVLVGSYLYLTNSSRLRRQMLRVMDELPLQTTTFDRISFSLWHGLEIGDLHLVLRGPGSLADNAQCVRAVVHVRQARISSRLTALLKGAFVPRAAALQGVDIAVTLPKTEVAAHGLETASATQTTAPAGPPSGDLLHMLRGLRIPELRVGDTNVRISQTDAHGTHLVRHCLTATVR